jgi:hypothetical protein
MSFTWGHARSVWQKPWLKALVLGMFVLTSSFAMMPMGATHDAGRETPSTELRSPGPLSDHELRVLGDGVSSSSDAAAERTVREAYLQLPLSFEANHGQTDPQVKFLARGSGYTLFLASTEAVLALSHPDVDRVADARETRILEPDVVRMHFVDANAVARVSGLDEFPGKSHYFIGNDPRNWRVNIPRYAKVRYEQIYPGIDVVYYGKQGQLEYDFIVHPGADPGAIELGFQGARELTLDASSIPS